MMLGLDLRCLPGDGSPGAGIAHASRELASALFACRPSGSDMIGYCADGASATFGFPLMRLNGVHRGRLLHALRVRPCDALFVPSGAVTPGIPIRCFPWIHDLDILDHPEWFPQSPFRRLLTTQAVLRGIRRAPAVFAVSEYAKRQIIAGTRVPERRVVVTGEGGDASFAAMNPSERVRAGLAARRRLSVRGLQRPFMLLLGTSEPRKNIPFLVRLWSALAPDFPPVDLVIAGSSGWQTAPIDAAVDAAREACAGTDSRILRFASVSDAARRDLLLAAELLIAPSLSEGFGLVPLEAVQAGTPVLLSDRGALPDVVGRGEWMIPLNDIHQWKHALLRAARDPRLRESWLAAQASFVRRWSWRNVAQTVWKGVG